MPINSSTCPNWFTTKHYLSITDAFSLFYWILLTNTYHIVDQLGYPAASRPGGHYYLFCFFICYSLRGFCWKNERKTSWLLLVVSKTVLVIFRNRRKCVKAEKEQLFMDNLSHLGGLKRSSFEKHYVISKAIKSKESPCSQLLKYMKLQCRHYRFRMICFWSTSCITVIISNN